MVFAQGLAYSRWLSASRIFHRRVDGDFPLFVHFVVQFSGFRGPSCVAVTDLAKRQV
jgi:hypothetical protein